MVAKKPLVSGLLLTLLLVALVALGLQDRLRYLLGLDGRVIQVDVVAIDQPLVYNRFGSFNPYGMVYALARDVVDCGDDPGECSSEGRLSPATAPGHARLSAGKRPRPLVLRGSVGDELVIRLTNLLQPSQPDFSEAEDSAQEPSATAEQAERDGGGPPDGETDAGAGGDNWPKTRRAGITIAGMTPIGDAYDTKVSGLTGVQPGESIVYRYKLEREGTHLFFSNDAPAGGEGDGGSLVHGLFGVVNVSPRGSRFYRSQVTADQLAAARAQAQAGHFLDYDAVDASGDPLLSMLKRRADLGLRHYELVHGDINAIVVDGKTPEAPAYREFTVVFHDELKTFYAEDFRELGTFGQLAGVGDGFAINYGASGMGTILLANRKGIGPAAGCVECLYEEFFLQSWANGDPALLPAYEDDPSNVHHAYLNDRVEFRNLHAGPKETHVFHLHAHQWLSQRETGTGTYLDSQTIAPQQGFAYPIEYGGGGNRNLTPGDAIFHCHLYPHFAQGMWALWRVHDVLEDGTRRLPDGALGSGTDPMTGATSASSGTPIPAVVPLPRQAMPPEPDYAAGLPGYPFYIAGEAGHRAPQPPLDLAEDAGLPRHVVTAGTRALSGLSATERVGMSADQLVEYAVRSGDFSGDLETASLKVLPSAGTALERAAMRFHAQPALGSKTPEGEPAAFELNGMPPQPGAPFADPCRRIDGWNGLEPVEYRVSAIQTDLIVNRWGWHDPQARINVLDEDVPSFENLSTADAKPFFFRAHSGDCISFYHTNRTPHELDLDDFQVRTPTDTIGQHIHLVKFDVTASDGSGNGFNYEDGTFAIEAVANRIEASHAVGGGAVDGETGDAVELALKPDAHQTTVQRWMADPLTGSEGRDRTIRTVFTHDHFAPSSIQQHGFYAALLIEPAGTAWLPPDSDTPMERGKAVGSQARILGADDPQAHPDHRELAIALADFALLYDPCFGKGGEAQVAAGEAAACGSGSTDQGLDALLAAAPDAAKPALQARLREVRTEHGRPVAPPLKPEAISKDHHDPYVFNYRNEPIPLRVAEGPSDSVKQQKPGEEGEMAFVFDSAVHGDPGTEIFEAYEGDRAQIRLIQGAQEVQHMFAVHGLRWQREIDNPASPYVAAQEIGISEHFEMRLPAFGNVEIAQTDYLYKSATVDDLWNGAWGLIRVYNGVERTRETDGGGPRLKPLPDNPQGRLELANAADFDMRTGCPLDAPIRRFSVEAWQVSDLTGQPLAYDAGHGLVDPHALAFVLAEDAEAIRVGAKALEPLVIRAAAGDCIKVKLANRLPERLPDDGSDALMPRIVPFNVGQGPDDGDSDVGDLQPSSAVTLHPQLVSTNTAYYDGAIVGRNGASVIVGPGESGDFTWYAGRLEPQGDRLIAIPHAFGPTNLVSYADAISHGVSGLIGALIVEEQGTTFLDPASRTPIASGTYAIVRHAGEREVHELVLLYQDGLSWRTEDGPVPNCPVCDDSYDQGEKGVNYRSAPFWARLGQPPDANLNAALFPPDFLTPAYQPVPTPSLSLPAGAEVVVHVLQPAGRARQRSFMVYGHDYQDMLPNFGSAHSSLISVEKAVTARLDGGAKPGCWIYRDGPAQLWAGGVWGTFIVGDPPPGSPCRIAQN